MSILVVGAVVMLLDAPSICAYSCPVCATSAQGHRYVAAQQLRCTAWSKGGVELSAFTFQVWATCGRFLRLLWCESRRVLEASGKHAEHEVKGRCLAVNSVSAFCRAAGQSGVVCAVRLCGHVSGDCVTYGAPADRKMHDDVS